MDAKFKQRLAEAIRSGRGDRSQRRYAQELGVSYAAVRSWEEQESLPNCENLEQIAATRNQSLTEFLNDLRGEDVDSRQEYRPKAAEDLLPMVNALGRAERARLAQMIVGDLAKDV